MTLQELLPQLKALSLEEKLEIIDFLRHESIAGRVPKELEEQKIKKKIQDD